MQKYTMEEVLAALKGIKDQIDDLQDERAVWVARLERLQRRCLHPNGYSYNDRSGVGCYACPDCGYDR